MIGRGTKVVGSTAAVLVAGAIIYSILMQPHHPQRNQKRAERSIRQIHTCAAAYARRHPDRGFPGNLREMAGSGESCLDHDLASGYKDFYHFSYTPGTVSAGGVVSSYVVRAEPVHFEEGNIRYYSDQSGVVRFTGEHREATSQDPVRVE